MVKRKLCEIIRSNVQGTPDLKFLAIFSENRLEWFITELAACSDSITIVPVSVIAQFVEDNRISSLLEKTEATTICVSRATIGVILDLKSRGKLTKLKNLILYD